MTRLAWNPERDAMLESCDDLECPDCDLGDRLLRALNDARVPTATELLVLVRLLAVTVVTTTPPEEQTQACDALVLQLFDDLDQFTDVPQTEVQ